MIPTHVTLEQGQGHQTWYELVDLKQTYDNAKFEKLLLNSIHKKASNSFCQIRKHVNMFEYVQKSKIVVDSLPAQCNQQSYKV